MFIHTIYLCKKLSNIHFLNGFYLIFSSTLSEKSFQKGNFLSFLGAFKLAFMAHYLCFFCRTPSSNE